MDEKRSGKDRRYDRDRRNDLDRRTGKDRRGFDDNIFSNERSYIDRRKKDQQESSVNGISNILQNTNLWTAAMKKQYCWH